MHILVKLLWAWRLLRAKHFVIATDKSAFCALDMVDPYHLSSAIEISAQAVVLNDLQEMLGEVIKEHQRISNEVFGEPKKPSKKSKPTKGVKKSGRNSKSN